MATVSIELRTDRVGPNGWAPARLRIAHRGTKRYISLGFKVLASKWNSDREEVTRAHPDQKEYNDDLSEINSTAQSALRSENRASHVVTARRLKEEIQKRLDPPEEGGYDFLSFAEERLEEYRRREKFSTFESYRSDLRKFRQFVEDQYGVEELPFDAIDVELVESFRTFCYEVRENSTNTVGKALETLRVFVNKALAEGKARSYPFKYIEIDSEPVQKDLLDPKEIDQIADLDLNEESFLAEVRRWFLFSYYTGGMRFSDVATLQWKHIRPGPSGYMRVYWKMQKTSDNVGVPLSDDAQQILRYYEDGSENDWVFPILEGISPDDGRAIYDRKKELNGDANDALKDLADRAGINKNASFHLSRNAAAWYLNQNVRDIYKVRDFLGHSSVEQTERYLDGFEDESKDDVFLEAMG